MLTCPSRAKEAAVLLAAQARMASGLGLPAEVCEVVSLAASPADEDPLDVSGPSGWSGVELDVIAVTTPE